LARFPRPQHAFFALQRIKLERQEERRPTPPTESAYGYYAEHNSASTPPATAGSQGSRPASAYGHTASLPSSQRRGRQGSPSGDDSPRAARYEYLTETSSVTVYYEGDATSVVNEHFARAMADRGVTQRSNAAEESSGENGMTMLSFFKLIGVSWGPRFLSAFPLLIFALPS